MLSRCLPVLACLLWVSTAAAAPAHYQIAYQSNLQGDWVRSCWEGTPALSTNFAATAPGRSGNAIEVRFVSGNAWNAFGLADRKPGWINQYKYFNEHKTIEFDLYFEPDTTGEGNLVFILEDANMADQPALTSFIPGWATMTPAQRYGQWFHITVNLAALHPNITRFAQFLLFNNGTGNPHFRIADVKLGWDDDLTPPLVTLNSASLNAGYDQLTLAFATDEATLYRIEYGVGNYNTVLNGPADDYTRSATATLGGLVRGTTVQYRIVARDHRTDPAATPNQGVYTGTYAIPAAPSTPPTVSGLAASNVTGSRATLNWTTDRATSAVISYRKNGGSTLTRSFSDLVTNRSVVLDLLEPSTAYTADVAVTDAFANTATRTLEFSTTAASLATVTINTNPASTRPISPWIYGINFLNAITPTPRNLTFNRSGGNRWTAYNWENNASNAGSDYGPYSSDAYLGGGNTPAEAVRSIVAGDRTRGTASLITLQLQGYVAADKNGNVNVGDPNHLANRFKQAVFRKGAAFTATPPTSDASVYLDEFLWTLRGKFSGNIYTDPATPTFVSLDNEPELWPDTHFEIQGGSPMPVATYIQRTIDLAKALKDTDPGVLLFGPVHYGFGGIVNWQGASGFTSSFWFTDKYLQDLKTASDANGRRLLDVYDLHWYSEAQGDGTRITNLTGTTLTPNQVQAIVQSPRSLWDNTYSETSWVSSYLGGPIFLLRRLQSKIDANWAGTKMAITEYANGGDNHIAGAIAQADNLGIFGREGLFAANYWPLTGSYPFVLAAFAMYRDYNGNLGSFGDVSLATTSTDTSKVAAYVSQDSIRAGRYVIVALNRSTTSQDVGFAGLAVAGRAKVYRIEGTQTAPVFVGEVPANLSSWVVTLPALSVSTIELQRLQTFADWQGASFNATELANPAISGAGADPDGSGYTNLQRYAFGLPARGAVVNRPVTLGTTLTGGQTYQTVSFNRSADATDLHYFVEATSDLSGAWTTLATINPGSPATVTVTDTVPQGSGKRAFRVRTTSP